MVDVNVKENFRTFEKDSDGNELHMTKDTCHVCNEKSEIYINLDIDWKELYKKCSCSGEQPCNCPTSFGFLICKTCLTRFIEKWNAKFIEHAKRNREEQEVYFRGE